MLQEAGMAAGMVAGLGARTQGHLGARGGKKAVPLCHPYLEQQSHAAPC